MSENIRIRAKDPRLQYIGRFDTTDDEKVSGDWAACKVIFRTNAKEVTFLIEDGECNHGVYVDGEPVACIVTEKDILDYKVELPGEGTRTVELNKRNGPNFGSATFHGFELPAEAELFDPPPVMQRKIEFIGDSLTIGYGNEGPHKDCDVLREHENSHMSFASITARQLNAQAHLVAISGFGAVRNWGDPADSTKNPVPYYYDRAMKSRRDRPWDFSKWIPDAVVIGLGSNDYWGEPVLPAEGFIKAYRDLITRVRGHYGDVPLFLVVTRIKPELTKRIEEIGELEKAEAKGHVSVEYFSKYTEDELGCDYHPKILVHERTAETLVPKMKEVLGW